MIFHAGPPTWLPGGFLGVSLFFTLSGYLITTLVLAEVHRDRTVGLAAFWSRRVRRLIPALVLLTVGVAIMARLVTLGRGIRVDIFGATTYTTNWIEIDRGVAYGDLFRAPSPLVHLWSLAIEEQFYLVLPLVAWVLARRAPWRLRRNLLVGSIVVVAVGFIATRLTHDHTLAYYGTIQRAPEIGLGALLACCTRPTTERSPTWLTWATFGALLVSVLAWRSTHVSDGWVTSGGLVLFAVFSATLVRGASQPGPAATVFSWPPLRRLGLISYGLYLYHWPIVVLLSPPRVDWAPVPLFVARVGISLLLAILSYHFIERRFRRGWPATPSGKVIAIGLVALATTLVVGVVVAPAGLREITHRKPAPAVVDPRASTTAPPPGVVGPAKIAIVGDSVPSWIIRDGGSGLDPKKVALVDGTLEACDGAQGNPVARSRTGELVPTPKGCTGWPTQYPPFFVRSDDVAVLMVGGHAALDRKIEGDFRSPCDPLAGQWYENDIVKRLQFLQRHADHVVLVLPTWADNLAEWIYPSDHVTRMDCVRSTLRAAATAEGAKTIDFADYVCPNGPGKCLPIRTHDGMHIDADKAPAALNWLIDRVLVASGKDPKAAAVDATLDAAPTTTATPAAPTTTTTPAATSN